VRTVRKVAGFVAGLTVCAAAPSADTMSMAQLPAACVSLNAAVLEVLPIAQSKQAMSAAELAQLRRPMTQRELSQVMDLLSVGDDAEPTEPGSPSGKAMPDRRRRPPERLPLPAERVGMVLTDATAILTRTNLDEAIAQIRSSPRPDKGMMQWAEGVMQGLDACLQKRYSEFGGDPAISQVRQLVLANRPRLEKLIMASAINARAPREPAGPGRQ
jgi:hypothetical protein